MKKQREFKHINGEETYNNYPNEQARNTWNKSGIKNVYVSLRSYRQELNCNEDDVVNDRIDVISLL